MNNENLPEAPASQTIKLSYKGFEILLTQRDLDVKMIPFLDKAKLVIDYAIGNGFEPPVRSNGFMKSKAPTKPCPIHPDKELRERESKDRAGEKYWSHSKGAYPNFGEWCQGRGYPSELEGQSSEEIGKQLDNKYSEF